MTVSKQQSTADLQTDAVAGAAEVESGKTGSDRRGSMLRAWLAVVALGVGVFAFVTTETLPVGLLPGISSGVGVSLGVAGFLVAAYAAVATLTAAPLAAWTGRLDRRWLMVGLLVVFVAGNLITALASSYAVLLGARILIGFTHGLFWSVVAPIAVRLVPAKHEVRATTIVLSGISVATVVGVPLGTFIGQSAGWRSAFFCVAGLGSIVLASVLFLLPPLPGHGSGRLSALPQLLRHGPLRAAIAVAGLVMIGNYLAFTYLNPYLQHVTGVPEGLISVLLLVFGVAGIMGNFLGGALTARSLHKTLVGATIVLVSTFVLLWAFGASLPAAVAFLAVWGASFAMLPVALQTWVMRLAPKETDAASSLYVTAFNGAIAGGSLIGGFVVDTVGPHSITAVAAALAVTALIVLSTARTGIAKKQEETVLP